MATQEQMAQMMAEFALLRGRLEQAENQNAQLQQQLQNVQQAAQQAQVQAQAAQVAQAAQAQGPGPAAPAAANLKPANPSRFSKPSKELTAFEWLFSLLMYFVAKGCNDVDQRIAYAVTLMDGTAAAWWRSVYLEIQAGTRGAFGTWQEFVTAFTNFFHPAGLDQSARNELRMLRQTGRVGSYTTIFQRLVLQVTGMDQGTIIDSYIHGLKDSIRAYVRTRRPATLLRAIEEAELYESSLTEHAREGHHAPPDHGVQPTDPMQLGAVMAQEDASGSWRASERPQSSGQRSASKDARSPKLSALSPGADFKWRKANVRCYNCGQFGHMAKDCMKTRYPTPGPQGRDKSPARGRSPSPARWRRSGRSSSRSPGRGNVHPSQ